MSIAVNIVYWRRNVMNAWGCKSDSINSCCSQTRTLKTKCVLLDICFIENFQLHHFYAIFVSIQSYLYVLRTIKKIDRTYYSLFQRKFLLLHTILHSM